MDTKTIVLAAICPVLLFGCETGEAPASGETRPDEPGSGYALPAPPYQVTQPDSMYNFMILTGNSPLVVVKTYPGGNTVPGDTAALCAHPFLAIETERMLMQLEISTAMGDTIAADSLRAILADSSVYIPLLSGYAGLMEVRVDPGDLIQPGDTLGSVKGPPPDSVYILLPGPGHIAWPGELSNCVVTPGGLLCRGHFPGDSASLPGTYSVPGHFIHEEGLATFLLTSAGDTIPVQVIGNSNGLRTVFSPVPIDSVPLQGWD